MEEKCQWGAFSGCITTAGISPAFTLSAPLTFIKLGSAGWGGGSLLSRCGLRVHIHRMRRRLIIATG